MNSDASNQPSPVQDNSPKRSVLHEIQKITAWVMIISAVMFALIGVLAIWQVFGNNAGDTIGRAFGSLVIIAFAALIVNVASRVGEGKH